MTAVSDWVPKGIALVVTFVLGHSLGPQDFALYTLALSWVAYAWTLSDQGLAGFGIRLVAASAPGHDDSAREILGIYTVLSVLTSLLLVACSLTVDGDFRLVLLAATLFVVAYAAFPDWLLRGFGALATLAAANWASTGLWLCLVLVAVAGESVTLAALAYGVAPLGGAAVSWWWLWRRRWRPVLWVKPTVALQRLRQTLLFSAGGILGGLAPPLMFSTVVYLATPSQSASLALGMRVSAAGAGAGWILAQNMLPKLVVDAETLRPSWSMALSALPGVGAVIVAAAIWPLALQPALGEGYNTGLPYFLAGVGYLVCLGVKYLAEALLLAGFRDRARLCMGGLTIGMTALLCTVAVTTRRPWVAVVGFGAAEAAAAALGVLLLRRELRAP